MAWLSVFAICTCGTPLFVKSETLKKCILYDKVEDCYGEARETIKERIIMEQEIKNSETNNNSHEIIKEKKMDNNDTMDNKIISDHNNKWKDRMIKVQESHDRDYLNEWEVLLLGTYIYIRENNRIQFGFGLFKFVFAVWLLESTSLESLHAFTVCILFVTIPYAMYKNIPLLIRIGLSNYITDEEVKYSILSPYHLLCKLKEYWNSCYNYVFKKYRNNTLESEPNDVNAISYRYDNNDDNDDKSSNDVEMAVINPMTASSENIKTT